MADSIRRTLPKRNLKISDTLLCVFSDAHTGSSRALFPPKGFVNDEGNLVSPNSIQREIYPVFVRFAGEVAKARKGKRLIIVSLGDNVDNFHHGSKQESLFKLKDQCEAHIEIMQDFMKRVGYGQKDDMFYQVRGTEVHVEDTENDMGEVLGAVPVADSNADKPRYVHEILELNINGALHVFAHHGKSRGSGQNEGSALAYFLRNTRHDRMKDGLPRIDTLWSGHTHAATWASHIERLPGYEFHQMHGIICPSWQSKTRYALAKVPLAVNSVGGVFVKIGADGTMGVPRFVVQTTKDN